MRRVLLGVVVMLAAGPVGCGRFGVRGSGVPKSETRKMAAFDELAYTGGGAIEIKIGTPQSVKITCDDNLLPLIETVVKDGRLVVRPTRNVRDITLDIKVVVPDLKVLSIDGAARVNIEGVDGKRLRVEANGAVDMAATGKTDSLTLELTGACKVRFAALAARAVTVSVTGAGTVDVDAAEQLAVTITGAGSVRYSGNPKVTKTIFGGGTVAKKR